MSDAPASSGDNRGFGLGKAGGWALGLWFAVVLALHLAALTRGWANQNLPGHEFRQAQTAVTAYYVQKEHNFSLKYPTPVLGKPWSVPFEFPLYQWSVVGVSEATGWPLVTCGRLVSAACLYLALPALWLLLGGFGVARRRRWIVLGFVLLCPIHVFYARAFLIEAMALLFALWFLAAFLRAWRGRGAWWWVLANVAGTGAGLVKVTTFAVVLVPVAVWVVVHACRGGSAPGSSGSRWRRSGVLALRAAALVGLPFLVSVAWVYFADAVKTQNPAAQFALSGNLRGFNFGTWAERLDPALWAGQAANLLQGVAGPIVLACGALAWCGARGARRLVLAAVGTFLVPLLVFPVLYKVHDYYFMANATFLAGGLGLAVAALLDRPGWRLIGVALLVAVPALQARSYLRVYGEWQAQPNPPGSQLTRILRAITDENDVLLVAGVDWSPSIPFHAQRRALMFQGGGMDDQPQLERSYEALAGERIGALVLSGAQRTNQAFIEFTVKRFALDARRLFSLGDEDVYVPVTVWASQLDFLRTMPVATLRLPEPPVVDEDPWRGRVVPVAELPPLIRRNFRGFEPEPVRSEATFDYSSAESEGGLFFSMHPTTRLWFKPPASHCRLETSYLIYGGAYEGKPEGTGTDGVQFTLIELRPGGSRRVVFSRLLDPARNAADRGVQTLALDLNLAADAELLLETTAGSTGNWAFDWAALGPLTLRATGTR